MANVNGGDTTRDKFELWSNPQHYSLALICWSNTFMNSYKFPELYHKYGSLQILIPYCIVTMFLVMPVMFTELAIGQYSNCGFVDMWRMAPLFRGIAWSTATISFFASNYGLFTTTHAGYYLVKSFETTLPWSKCDSSWAKNNCYNAINPPNLTGQNSVEHFHKEFVLGEHTVSFSETNLRLFLFMFASLAIVLICLIDRIRTIQKIINLLTLVPFILLIVLSVASLLNRSDVSGMYEFVRPDFPMLMNPQMWLDVTNNAMMNIGLGMGGLTCIAAHGNFRTNIFSLTLFTPFYNLLVDMFFTLFVYTSFLEQTTLKNTTLLQLFDHDASLLFVKMPMALLDWPSYQQIWTILYFMYLYIIGLRHLLFILFTLTLGLHEMLHCVYYLRKFATGVICFMMLFVMPLYISPLGNSMYTETETFCSSTFLTFIATIEIVGVYYLYNAKHLMVDVHFMLNKRFKYMEYGLYLLPIALGAVCVMNFYVWATTKRDYRIHWIFITQIVVLILMVFFWFSHFVVYSVFNWDKTFRYLMKPTESWGCRDDEIRQNREFFKSENADVRFVYRQELYERTIQNMN